MEDTERGGGSPRGNTPRFSPSQLRFLFHFCLPSRDGFRAVKYVNSSRCRSKRPESYPSFRAARRLCLPSVTSLRVCLARSVSAAACFCCGVYRDPVRPRGSSCGTPTRFPVSPLLRGVHP
ncbi:hypothetical protein MRX96_007531 [Rhipicephalus microplus]